MRTLPPDAQHDPVCATIESLLRDLEAQGKGELEEVKVGQYFQLRFGGLKVIGLTREIALVRLASAMMDDELYQATLMKVLRGPMRDSP